MQGYSTLSTPPIIQLGARQWIMPAILASIGLVASMAMSMPLEWHAVPELAAFILFIGGVYWLKASWQPGRGSPQDIILPWGIVGLLAACGLYLGGNAQAAWQSVQPALAMALPFIAATTLLGRHYAPTDLCSASSSIGFTCGALACALAGLHYMPAATPDIMLAGAMGLGITMGASRIVLCHILKW